MQPRRGGGAPPAAPRAAAAPPPRAAAATAPPAALKPILPAAAASFYGGAHAASRFAAGAPPAPLHDPSAPGALVLSPAADARFTPPAAAAVVVDPYISARLRPHQREGVAFLYESVMGLRGPHSGCLLCDDMGVGKTLQLIALLWTLLRQSPAAGGGAPAVRRALVVCPASLVAQWRSEVRKWLGPTRLGVTAIGGGPKAKAAMAAWAARGQVASPLCVTSYETLRACAAEAAAARPGLLICDEGHRLKNAAGSKTLEALQALGAPMRVILSGTPVQNNLEEFFALAEFVAPGALGERAAFRRDFAAPIEASRDAAAPPAARRAGAAAAAALAARTQAFMLRRTADVNAQHLPPRQEYVVFCRPSPLQAAMYEALLGCPEMKGTLSGQGGAANALPPLVAITLLRRLCTSPAEALRAPAAAGAGADAEERAAAEAAAAGDSAAARALAQLRQLLPADGATDDVAHSGKMAALAAILRRVAASPRERIVLVAGWTSTLDALAALCASLQLVTCRLDGATPPAARSHIVRAFNAGSGGRGGATAAARVCLLSTRAGGVGLSLVGANRLVLFDSDWNPALDAQACARVWRDGQTRDVAVYRLVTAGTLEEKIYQRSLVKREVAAAVAKEASARHFAAAELKQLFEFTRGAVCDTAALLRRQQGGGGGGGGGGDAAAWRDASADVADAPLADAIASGVVTFVHAPPPSGSAAARAAAQEAARAAADDVADTDDDLGDVDFEDDDVAEDAPPDAAPAGRAEAPPAACAGAGADVAEALSGGGGGVDDDDDDFCVPESPAVAKSPPPRRAPAGSAADGDEEERRLRRKLDDDAAAA